MNKRITKKNAGLYIWEVNELVTSQAVTSRIPFCILYFKNLNVISLPDYSITRQFPRSKWLTLINDGRLIAPV